MPAPRAIHNRCQLQDDLRAVIGQAANLDLPDWPALTDAVEVGIGGFQQALALLEGGESRAEHLAHHADLRHADGQAPRGR